MYVKIHNPKGHGGNKNSSEGVFKYLDKENEGKEIHEQNTFFSHYQEGFGQYEVSSIIDNNNAKLGKEDEKFFMLTLNPSPREIEHIQNKYSFDKVEDALKQYTRDVMDEYAKNFNRDILRDTGEKYTKENPIHRDKIISNEALLKQENELKSLLKNKKLLGDEKTNLKEELSKVQEKFHLGGDGKRIAENTKIKIVERKLEGGDLVYFGKVETQRHYKPDDKEHQDTFKHNKELRTDIVQKTKDRDKAFKDKDYAIANKLNVELAKLEKQYIRNTEGKIIKPHELKDGKNHHVHVVVSRKDMTQTLKLHPLTNSKGSANKLNGIDVQIGFNRDKFAERAENAFDKRFEYDREVKDKYTYLRDQKNDTEKAIKAIIKAPTNEREAARKLVRELTKDIEVKKVFDKIPKNVSQLRSKAIDMAVNKIAVAMKLNPAGLAVTVAKSIVKSTFGDVAKSFEILR